MFKSIIIKIAKKIINHLERLNEIYLENDGFIHANANLVGSKIKGKIVIHERSSILNSTLIGNIKVANNCKIERAKLNGEIELSSNINIEENVIISGNVFIDRYSYISGPNTDIIGAVNGITIGSFCSIARNVSIQEYNHYTNRLTTSFLNTNFGKGKITDDITSKGSIEIGHDVWIGTHCVILSGAKIGTGAIIAANSVVTEEIPPYAIAAGSPAKIIKYRFNKNKIEELLASEWWLKNETEILNIYKKFDEVII